MKLTTQRLKKLIREELSKLTEQESEVSITIIYQNKFGSEDEIDISEAEYDRAEPIIDIKNEYEDAMLSIEGIDVEGDPADAEIELTDVDDLDDLMGHYKL